MALTLLYSSFLLRISATIYIYTLSLHDALPIWPLMEKPSSEHGRGLGPKAKPPRAWRSGLREKARACRSEEHTSELQSHHDLVCRLLLEKKKIKSDVQANFL